MNIECEWCLVWTAFHHMRSAEFCFCYSTRILPLIPTMMTLGISKALLFKVGNGDHGQSKGDFYFLSDLRFNWITPKRLCFIFQSTKQYVPGKSPRSSDFRNLHECFAFSHDNVMWLLMLSKQHTRARLPPRRLQHGMRGFSCVRGMCVFMSGIVIVYTSMFFCLFVLFLRRGMDNNYLTVNVMARWLATTI